MPNRIIKESICTSDTIDQLSPLEEIFFYRLMVQCDDFGRMDARPAILRAKCFPLRVESISLKEIEALLQALVDTGLVVLYEVDGNCYLRMATWDKHQSRRAKRSKYPDPPAEAFACKQMQADEITCKQMQAYVPEESRNRGIEESRNREYENTRNRGDGNQLSSSEFTKQAIQEFEGVIGFVAGGLQLDEIKDVLTELESRGVPDWWSAALKIAADQNKRSWAYVRAILRNCLREGKAPNANARDSPPPKPIKRRVKIIDPDTQEIVEVEARV